MACRFRTPVRAALLCAGLLLALGSGPATPPAVALGGRILVAGEGIELLDLSSGRVRTVARRASQPAFFPSGKKFAYIREGGCFPAGGGSCYTEYSVFTKSLTRTDPAFAGRRLFGWREFFVRAVDVSRRGRLVFSAKRRPGPARHGNNLDIYSAGLDGSDVRQLTDNPAFENDPTVSPNGRWIAFTRKVDGRGQIFSIRIDGTHLRQLTHNRMRNRLPSWSADGRRIAFISQPPGHGGFPHREIYTMSARGGRARRLTHNRAIENQPTYSPDGRSIAFLRMGGLWVMRASGKRPRKVLAAPNLGGYEEGLDWGRGSSAQAAEGEKAPLIVGGKVGQRAHLILGGKGAQDGELPSLVFVAYLIPERDEAFVCSGTVLAPRWILTAAHCLDPPHVSFDIENLRVIAGSVNWKDPDREVLHVERATGHWRYNARSGENDVALLKLDAPTRALRTPLAGRRFWQGGSEAEMAGWGVTRRGQDGATYLLHRAPTTVLGFRDCRLEGGRRGQICAEDVALHKTSACYGDSGGPLLMRRPGDRKLVVIGVVHGGDYCNLRAPTLFTSTVAVFRWVRARMAE